MRPISIVRTAANRAKHGDCAVHNHVDLNPTAQNDRGRTLRSRSDRTAIGRLTWGNRCQSIRGRSTEGQDHDRGPIAARSWPDRGPIVAKWTAISERN